MQQVELLPKMLPHHGSQSIYLDLGTEKQTPQIEVNFKSIIDTVTLAESMISAALINTFESLPSSIFNDSDLLSKIKKLVSPEFHINVENLFPQTRNTLLSTSENSLFSAFK